MTAGTLRPMTSLTGAAVLDSAGETLGAIEDAMIDDATGAIAYVVLKTGGVLGVGEKLHAVPWSALRVGESASWSVDARKSEVEALDGFDKDAWPLSADPGWT